MYSLILKSYEFINNLKTASSRLIKNISFIWRSINENYSLSILWGFLINCINI
ncbi:conserved hypothetical protein (plasmid) [Borreliella finlandensis]|uniref:Uncharacterized protein n=1 Tax=Borreliella finlandensis TaxID=498741 RepID=A0A806CL49_9SPIR|nr:conserved hypothetical protein [Borreliella finlandensis]